MPVGPEFQDPPPVANEPPYVVLNQTIPYPWTSVPVNSSTPTMFMAVAGDANLDDVISARWVANYPPNSTSSTIIQPQDCGNRGVQQTCSLMQSFLCKDFPQAADITLTLLVSDRSFLDQASGMALNPYLPYSYDANGEPINTIVGWRIIGCSQ